MKPQTYIDEAGDDLTTQCCRATSTAQALGIEVILRRSQIEIVVYPQSYWLDICRLYQVSLEHRKWRIR